MAVKAIVERTSGNNPVRTVLIHLTRTWVHILPNAVPPLRSGFLDFGPDPDFFGQIGPDSVRFLFKSPDFLSNEGKNA